MIAFCLPAPASELTSLWQIEGTSNTVFLMGSVHLLRPEDHPLDPALTTAYREAEALLMEIDLDDLSLLTAATTLQEKAIPAGGKTLRDLIGDETWTHADSRATAAGFNLRNFDRAEPWYAAMLMTQLAMSRHGYDAELGIDQHFATLAMRDDKPILGLESFDEQLDIFDSLPIDSQVEMLLQTLEDVQEYSGEMREMVDAWRSGNTAFLENELLNALSEYPALHRKLVIDRNRNWIDRIEALLDRPDDYLVIVGVLHLVGDHSVNRLLQERGHSLRQVAATNKNTHH